MKLWDISLFYDFVIQHRLRKSIGLCYFIVANVPVRANCFEFRTRLDQAGRGVG